MVRIVEHTIGNYKVYWDDMFLNIEFCNEDFEREGYKEFRVNSTDYQVHLDDNNEIILTQL